MMDGKENLDQMSEPRKEIYSGMVSIIVPIYNGEKNIEKCILSILNQTYKKFELILIDDGSTDNSLKICYKNMKKDERIRVFHYENSGVSMARNYGIEKSRGEYVTFVDADDALEHKALEIAVKTMIDTEADVVFYGWYRCLNKTELAVSVCDSKEICEDMQSVLKKILGNYSDCGGGYPWNKLWKRSDYLEISFFNRNLSFFEDLDWVVRMLKKVHTIALCTECLYRYNVSEEGTTLNPEKKERNELHYHMALNKINENLKSYFDESDWLLEKYSPEIVNGIIHARRHGWNSVEIYLRKQLNKYKKFIFKSKKISYYVKIRLLFLILEEKIKNGKGKCDCCCL